MGVFHGGTLHVGPRSAELAELTGGRGKDRQGWSLYSPRRICDHLSPPHLRMRLLALLVWAALAPTSAFAQCAISGLVSSSAGSPVSGAAVEARSPALIEQVRRATTDMSGRYRLEGLPPGTYSLRVSAPDVARGGMKGLRSGRAPRRRSTCSCSGPGHCPKPSRSRHAHRPSTLTPRNAASSSRGPSSRRSRRHAVTTRSSSWFRASSPTAATS